MSDGGPRARIAFVGCGRHASANLLPCIPRLPEIDLIAVCDLKAEAAEMAARNFGARRWYTDVSRLLGEERELDGVAIVGTPMMMKSIGEQVMRERGLPIFVEKPPAISAEEAEALATTARDCGTWGQVGFMKRFAAGYRLAKEAVDDPSFGPVSALAAKFCNGDSGPFWGLPSGGLTFIVAQAVHTFDLVLHFAGPVSEVYARYLERSPETHGFAVTLGFVSGAIGTLNINSFESWHCIDEYLSVSGVHNYVTVDDMLYVNVFREKGWSHVSDGDFADNFSQTWRPTGSIAPDMRMLVGYRDELRQFARCILERRRPGPDLEAGVAAMRLGQAVWESATAARPVTL